MSEHPRQPYRDMMNCAERLVEMLRPACTRIEIAGSLRRQRPWCADIELVALPKPVLNLIGEPMEETEVDRLLDSCPVTFTKHGHKFQQFYFDGTTAPFYVDLFLPLPECWGVVYMIRTGASEFSHKMVTSQSIGGYKPNQYLVRDGRVVRNDGTVLETPEEESVFELWGMKWIEPKDRV